MFICITVTVVLILYFRTDFRQLLVQNATRKYHQIFPPHIIKCMYIMIQNSKFKTKISNLNRNTLTFGKYSFEEGSRQIDWAEFLRMMCCKSWWRHQKHFPRDWPFMRGIHRPPVDSPRHGIDTSPGPRLNIKTVFPRYGDSHVKEKDGRETVLSLT